MPLPNSPVYLKDVAEVVDGIREVTSVSRFNGKNGIGLCSKNKGDANAVDVSKAVRSAFEKIEKQNAQHEVIRHCRRQHRQHHCRRGQRSGGFDFGGHARVFGDAFVFAQFQKFADRSWWPFQPP
jgi:hypothetical protein